MDRYIKEKLKTSDGVAQSIGGLISSSFCLSMVALLIFSLYEYHSEYETGVMAVIVFLLLLSCYGTVKSIIWTYQGFKGYKLVPSPDAKKRLDAVRHKRVEKVTSFINEKVTNFINRGWRIIAGIVGVILILAGLVIIGFQILIFLKNGQWVELPLLFLVSFGPEEINSWLYSPTSWLGLHKIIYGTLELIPLSLFSFLSGIVIASTADNE